MSETKAITLSDYMRKPAVMTRFENLFNKREAEAYVQSVLIAVSASPDLMKCTPDSVLRSALRAASLGLSCDPALKQAWLVPYNRKVKTASGEEWIKEAQFQPHYKGLYTLAMRTGKYWQINVSPVYEGQRVLENPLTGLHAVREDNGMIGKPDAMNAAYIDVTVRRKSSQKIIGWIGYFKTKKGFEKSVWMSAAEIEDHAQKYVKDYDKNPNWKDPEKRQVMEMKTVLRALLSWADMSGTEGAQLTEALREEEPIDAPAEDVTPTGPEAMTIEKARLVLVPRGKGQKPMGDLDLDSVNEIYLNESSTPEQQEAALLILAEDFKAEPPATQPRTKEQNLKDLGY